MSYLTRPHTQSMTTWPAPPEHELFDLAPWHHGPPDPPFGIMNYLTQRLWDLDHLTHTFLDHELPHLIQSTCTHGPPDFTPDYEPPGLTLPSHPV